MAAVQPSLNASSSSDSRKSDHLQCVKIIYCLKINFESVWHCGSCCDCGLKKVVL